MQDWCNSEPAFFCPSGLLLLLPSSQHNAASCSNMVFDSSVFISDRKQWNKKEEVSAISEKLSFLESVGYYIYFLLTISLVWIFNLIAGP